MPVKDASDVAGGVDLLRLTLEEEGMAQQLVVLGPLALFLFHIEDFSATYGQFNFNAGLSEVPVATLFSFKYLKKITNRISILPSNIGLPRKNIIISVIK